MHSNNFDIEKKWQLIWSDNQCFKKHSHNKKKYYNFDSAPSTNGPLHLGHARNYILGDVVARFKRLQGYDVLYTTSFDAFGLPNELSADKLNISADIFTEENISEMLNDLTRLGISYDYSYIKTTSDPSYYKWTQWLFLLLYKEGLVKRKRITSNWCSSCNSTLSYMEIKNTKCTRCDSRVILRKVDQWVINVSTSLDALYQSIERQNGFSKRIKNLLNGYYARVVGNHIYGNISKSITLSVFLKKDIEIEQCNRVISSIDNNQLSKLLDSLSVDNAHITTNIHHIIEVALEGKINGRTDRRSKSTPLVTEYDTELIVDFGSGCQLPLYISSAIDTEAGPQLMFGVTHNDSSKIKKSCKNNVDTELVHYYYVHDWVVSRGKTWGTPIPILHCSKCGYVPVSDDDLPVNRADRSKKYCPGCHNPASLVNETLDCYIDDSWCFIAGAMADLSINPFEQSKSNDWLPADNYHAGIDIYNYLHVYRFISLFLFNQGYLSVEEMFLRHDGHDMILFNKDKMSKSKGTHISLKGMLKEYGADNIRLAIILSCNPQKPISWNNELLVPAEKMIKKLRQLATHVQEISSIEPVVGKNKVNYLGVTKKLKKVKVFYDEYRPNAAVRELANLTNKLLKAVNESIKTSFTQEDMNLIMQLYKSLLIAFSPVIPHVCEELWKSAGESTLITEAEWLVNIE